MQPHSVQNSVHSLHVKSLLTILGKADRWIQLDDPYHRRSQFVVEGQL